MRELMSLDLVKSGSRVIIKEIQQIRGIGGRLYRIGILPGTELEVIVNNGRGPIVVKVKDTEVALGRGLARKILVEVLNNA
ncbi:MAG: FeoA family protein [Ignisphaera sp.]